MPGLNATKEDLDHFIDITQATHEDALHFLSSGTTLQGSIEDYYAAQAADGVEGELDLEDEQDESDLNEAIMSHQESDPSNAQLPAAALASGGRGMTLGGDAVDTTLPKEWGKPGKKAVRGGGGGGIATLSNTGSAPADDTDTDDEAKRRGETLYAGGERSGLAVQTPDQSGAGGTGGGSRGLVDKILHQAKENSKEASRKATPAAGSRNPFGGSGNTLGTDETTPPVMPEAASAPTPTARPPTGPGGLLNSLFGRTTAAQAEAPTDEDDNEEPQVRHLTFWRDGFSIEDGPLMRYDEPGNKELLETIEAGRAPRHLFNVKFNQPLSLEVAKKLKENYRPPPKQPGKPFEGSGNRLGSPAPEIAGSGSNTPNMPGEMRPQGILQNAQGATSVPSSATGAGDGGSKFEVDESKPTTSVQMRLGDGTRMVARVNLTHTIADLRNFVSAARPDARSFVLQTTFPSRELSDSSETVESAKLQNAVVVQRYT